LALSENPISQIDLGAHEEVRTPSCAGGRRGRSHQPGRAQENSQEPQEAACAAEEERPTMLLHVLPALLFAHSRSYSCQDDHGCELLGKCVGGACVCKPGFTGVSCGSVALRPVAGAGGGAAAVTSAAAAAPAVWPPQAALWGNTTFSWGFTVVWDPVERLYHAAVNAGCCGLGKAQHWPPTNPPPTCGVTVGGTLLAHVTSQFPDRGFRQRDIFVGPTAFNPHLIRAPNGTFILYFRVNDDDEWAACTGDPDQPRVNSSTLPTLIRRQDITHTDPTGEGPGANMYVAHATNMSGPWTTSRVQIEGMGQLHISNPSITLLASGKVMLAYR
jgi:hypothetical protein